jgi:hypothetical protein
MEAEYDNIPIVLACQDVVLEKVAEFLHIRRPTAGHSKTDPVHIYVIKIPKAALVCQRLTA